MVKKVNSNTYENGDVHAIGGNSVVFTTKKFVAKSGPFLVLATNALPIAGKCKMNATMASDNQTVAKQEVVYEEQKPQTTREVEITGGTITAADEEKYYNLTDADTVDGTSESTTFGQLQLKKFISATKGLFKIVNVTEDLIS
jgi:uncharacterized iron-regulated membrane protein